MTIDTLEMNQLERQGFQVNEKLSSLHENFQSAFKPEQGMYESFDTAVMDESIQKSFGLGEIEMTPEIRSAAVRSVKDMYSGHEVNGHQSLSLKEINGWKINEAYRESNLNQHAGYAAEVISTNKENFNAKLKHSGEITYRADDLPKELLDQFDGKIIAKNDQYVDKVRVKADGTVETIQTKFVGKDAKECLDKLKSKPFDKYFEGDAVDKVEIPKEYYDEIKNELIPEQIEKNKRQFENQVNKNSQTAENLQKKMDRLDAIDKKIEQSCVTKAEAKYAVEHPKLYAAQQINNVGLNAAQQINNAGLKQGAQAAMLTAAVSGVSNYQKYESGELTGEEAILNTVKDSAVSGGIAYGTEVVTQLAGGSSIPAAVVTMGVTSYGDIKDYQEGKLTEAELSYQLGENAASVAGGAVGGMVGGTVGSVAGPVGTAAGAMVGSAVGSAVASGAYQVTAEFVGESVEDAKDYIDGEIDQKELAERIGDHAETAAVEVKESIDATAATLVEAGENVQQAAAYVAADVSTNMESLKNVSTEKLNEVANKAGELKSSAAGSLDVAADKAVELKDSAFSTISGVFNH